MGIPRRLKLIAVIIFLLLFTKGYPTSKTPDFTLYVSPTPGLNNQNSVKGAKSTTVLVKVIRVVDGDTIVIAGNQKVRYIGIDTPEISNSAECFSQEAKRKNEELVLGKEVKLEKDISDKDKYGRLLRYVWVKDSLINEVLVKEGYANVATYPPNVKYQPLFLEAQKEARDTRSGLWRKCGIRDN